MSAENPNNPYQVPATDVLQADDPSAMAREPRAVPAANGLTWVSDGWALFKRAPGPMIAMFLVYFVINTILGVIPLVGFVSPLITSVLMGGVFIALARLDHTGELKIEDLFAAFNTHLMPLILLGLLLLGAGVILIGGAMVLGLGTVLGSDPGTGSILFFLIVVLLAVAVFFTLYFVAFYATMLVVLGNQGLGEAMSNAFNAFTKNVLPFLINSIVITGILLIALIPLGLGLLVAGPLVLTSMYASYRDIFAAK